MIIVNIDKKEREFKSLSQEDIIWYSQDLINKSSNSTNSIKVFNNTKPIKNATDKQKYYIDFYGRDFNDNSNKQPNFEKALIDVLIGIEVVLNGILKNNKNGD